ncbi:14912_t:CDS:2, partial [Funneliformis geosporum]
MGDNAENIYPYEISFIDNKQLERNNNERYRFFYHKDKNITIKDNSYSEKIKELQNQTNLMPEEEGRKFVEDLETELNKKTGKENQVQQTVNPHLNKAKETALKPRAYYNDQPPFYR